jgi:hypothetical protein
MKKVNFLITSFEDPRKSQSELELYKVFQGEITEDAKQVYYTDNADTQWVFWVGDTCTVMDSNFIMQLGIAYDFKTILPFLPPKLISDLILILDEGSNLLGILQESTFDKNSDLKTRLESIGFTISFDFEGGIKTITKID